MKKVMLHVSIGMLLVTSAIVYPSQSYSGSEPYSSSGSETGSLSGSESSSPALSPHNSPRNPRQMASSTPLRGMSAAQLNVPSNLRCTKNDQIIYSRETSPQVSPNLTRNPKEKSLDREALNNALNQEQEKQKKRDLIAKNCAHMIDSDDESEIARKGIELINSVFSDTETPAATPRNPSPIRKQSTNPEIRIFPPSGHTTPDKQPSPRISPRKELADSSDRRILDDVAASLNGTSPSNTLPKNPANSPEIPFAAPTTDLSQELCDLLEELKNKEASTNGKPTTYTHQEILKLKNDSNKAWEEGIKKVRKAKNNLTKSEETKTPPPSLKRSRWVIGSVCILAMAVALFYAHKLWWSTTENVT